MIPLTLSPCLWARLWLSGFLITVSRFLKWDVWGSSYPHILCFCVVPVDVYWVSGAQEGTSLVVGWMGIRLPVQGESESGSESHSVSLSLCDPMDYRAMEFSRQEYCSGLPFPSLGDLPAQGCNLGLLHCRRILYGWATREPHLCGIFAQNAQL